MKEQGRVTTPSAAARVDPGRADAARKDALRVALIGSGPSLVTTLDALAAVPAVTLTAVVDVTGHSEGAQRAARLGIRSIANAMDVFRTDANLVVETNGDARLYDRLLAIKPHDVEVLSALGLRLLLDAAAQGGGRSGAEGPHVDIIVARDRLDLYAALRDGLTGVPNLQVLLDRRRIDRRSRLRAQATERRQSTRRVATEADAALQRWGLAVVRRERTASPT